MIGLDYMLNKVHATPLHSSSRLVDFLNIKKNEFPKRVTQMSNLSKLTK
jgi:hypothetical protein